VVDFDLAVSEIDAHPLGTMVKGRGSRSIRSAKAGTGKLFESKIVSSSIHAERSRRAHEHRKLLEKGEYALDYIEG
jgi:hypothetical protein